MVSLPFLIAFGPCLIMAMGALALAVVNLGLSRSHHALYWSLGSALGAIQWGLLARFTEGEAGVLVNLLVHLLGVASILLLVHGLHVRRDGRAHGRAVAILAAASLTVMAAAGLLPPMPLRAAALPGVSALLLAWAGRLVVTPAAPNAPTETTVIATLLALAIVYFAAAAAAVGEQLGLVATHRPFVAILLAGAEPASAGVVLALLMLIAFDYAVELRRLLHTDPLTGVLNREGFEHAAKGAFERGRARRLAMAVADVDWFKRVNDAHGHAVGDATLTGVASHLAGRLGREGVLARIGGEEFAILFPGLDADAALDRVEALRRGLATVTLDAAPALRVTASFGIAERAPGEPLAALMERADAALYRAKRQGRNRSALADALPA